MQMRAVLLVPRLAAYVCMANCQNVVIIRESCFLHYVEPLPTPPSSIALTQSTASSALDPVRVHDQPYLSSSL